MQSYYELLEVLAPLDRSHNSPDMHKSVSILCDHYDGSMELTYLQETEHNYWKVPPYWTCEYATLKDQYGKVLASYLRNPMELFSFSPAVKTAISGKELRKHIFSDPKRPKEVIFHFRNQYRHWAPEWGFCIPHELKEKIIDDKTYHVDIKTNFDTTQPMKQAELFHQGETNETIVLVGHFDHPCQVNDGLAGCIAAFEAVSRLKGLKTRYSYLALAAVEIVGSALFLANQGSDRNFKEALFVGFAGIDSNLVYQRSYRGKAINDFAIPHILENEQNASTKVFDHRELIGNDENVFDSAGCEIPCGTLMRWPFPEYHSERDNMTITSQDKIEQVIEVILNLVNIHEGNQNFEANFKGLPCLSNPSLNAYMDMNVISGVQLNNANHLVKGQNNKRLMELAKCTSGEKLNKLMQRILREADGTTSLLDLCIRCKVPFDLGRQYFDILVKKGIINAKY